MDVREIAEDHAELLAAILAASSGPLGEILVARAMRRHGCKVTVLANNWRQRDLQIVTRDGRDLFIETKTVRQKGSCWIVNTPPDPARSQFWVLVHAPRKADSLPCEEDVRFFVLTSGEALEAWNRSSPAINSKAAIEGDIRAVSEPFESIGDSHR